MPSGNIPRLRELSASLTGEPPADPNVISELTARLRRMAREQAERREKNRPPLPTPPPPRP